MPTIWDVAHRAGVSIKTVSRVLNRDGAVRAEMAERVNQAIGDLGYEPNLAARAMRTGRLRAIGLVDDDVTATPYAVDIVRGIQDACAASDTLLLISSTRGDPALMDRAVRGHIARKVEGIIFATRYLRVLEELPDTDDVPLVLVNCVAPDRDRPAILPDDEGGSFAATGHLLDLGHRKIALVSINPAIMAARRRGNGFSRAMQAHGLEVLPGFVQAGQHFDATGEPFTTDAAVEAIFASDPDVTAILCGTDALAMRVCNALRRRGMTIPDDVSVIGFDNFAMIAEGLDPPLTSVALPYYAMGQAAVSRLRSGGGPSAEAILFPCPLVPRGSCGAPSSSRRVPA